MGWYREDLPKINQKVNFKILTEGHLKMIDTVKKGTFLFYEEETSDVTRWTQRQSQEIANVIRQLVANRPRKQAVFFISPSEYYAADQIIDWEYAI